MKVSVLLATYNGEKYLREQIDSILNQSYKDFHIYISDDNSKDDTKEIINEYVDKYTSKISLLKQDTPAGSAKGNFIFLLKNVQSDLYLFCDQDDVWTENHIEVLVNKYLSLPSDEKNIPILIHSDMVVVNEKLEPISDSFFKYTRLPRYPGKRFYYLSNNVTGCVCLINDMLKHFVFRDPLLLESNMDKIIMHDHFFSLIAVEFGKRYFLNEKTNYYRQHTNNELGAGQKFLLLDKISKILIRKQKQSMLKENNIEFEKNKVMLSFFLSYFPSLIIKEREIMGRYVNIRKENKVWRMLFVIKNGILRFNFFRDVLFLYMI